MIAVLVTLLVLAFEIPQWNGWFFPLLVVVAILLRFKVSREGYTRVAETFGCLPTLHPWDNLRQAAFVLTVGGALYGLGRLFGEEPALVSLLAGVVVAFLISGFRLMFEWNRRHR